MIELNIIVTTLASVMWHQAWNELTGQRISTLLKAIAVMRVCAVSMLTKSLIPLFTSVPVRINFSQLLRTLLKTVEY